MSGYFEIGIYRSKFGCNVGTLMRSAYQLGAAGIFTVNLRYKWEPSDIPRAWKNVPLRHYADIDDLLLHMPQESTLVGVEIGGTPLTRFCHPKRAIYLLGAEDDGLPPSILSHCHCVVSLESLNYPSYNVAVAGSLVMYDRVVRHAKGGHGNTIGGLHDGI